MVFTQARRAALVIVCLASACYSGEKKVSVADCRFATNPDEFLGRQSRIHRQINDRVAKLSRVGERAAAAGEIPRRNFIDQEILGKLANLNVPSSPLSSDAEFLRRVYLDLTGRLPDADTVRAFLASTSGDKRDAVIERLLGSAEFTDRWTMWMGDLLQNTTTLTNAAVNRNAGGRNAFHAYIKDAIRQDKSFRAIATEVITGKGNNYDAGNGAANFALGASTSMGPVQDTYDTMAVKTTTTFLGLSSYDCLLCHNGRGHVDQLSLWARSRTRIEAQGMAAFFSRMVFTPGAANSNTVTDSGGGGYNLNTDSGNRPNRVPVGSMTSLTPFYRETDAAPANGDWRAAFAENLVKDPMFARNLANRIWKQMFGLALVDPVDSLDPARLDPANPPGEPWSLQATHPDLLERLAAELAKQDFRLRAFLRTLAQSSAYQLSSSFEGEWKEEYVPLFARHYARRMEGEEVADAIAMATGTPGNYSIAGWPGPVEWAMQLPEPVEPSSDAAASRFMNTFLRGDRDAQERSQSGSIQQQLSLMNDPFVINRVKLERSPKLQFLSSLTNDGDVLNEIYLSFLSRPPTDAERAHAASVLQRAAASGARSSAMEDLAWMCINKVEFMFSY